MSNQITIIDYGIGNLLSVVRAFEYCGADVIVTNNPANIRKARHLVLPGVGAFSDGMQGLRGLGIIDSIVEHAENNKPLLGICLGMQMLFESSCEFGMCEGLGIIPGTVEAIPSRGSGGKPHNIPHIGWNELLRPSVEDFWEDTICNTVCAEDAVYFVHSFMAVPLAQENRLADCDYNGIKVSAVVRKGNTYGTQFHPEKSGEVGLQIVRSFIKSGR